MRGLMTKTVSDILAEREALLSKLIGQPRKWVKALNPSELTHEVHQYRNHYRYNDKIRGIVVWYDTRYVLSMAQRSMLEQFLLEVKFNVQ